MTGYVWMHRPDLPNLPSAQVPRAAFEAAHRHQGWVECEAPPEPTQADLDAAVRATEPEPPPGEEPTPDAPAKTGGRTAARGKAGPSKGKE